MAEQDFKFDDALLMKTAREMLAKKLTETVKEVAKSGEWEITTIEQEESDPEKILSTLSGKITKDFPPYPQIHTQIKYVQKSMEDYLSPAFYMIPAIDNTSENIIYINNGHLTDNLSLFTTLAHEGYPGHLYQNVYYASLHPNPIRCVLNYGGYTEGWATYSEMMSYYFSTLTKEQATIFQRNSSVILGLYALADMGIHYDGWKLADAAGFFGCLCV